MSFTLTITGETLEDLKKNLKKFFDEANSPYPPPTPRKKVVPGENLDLTIKEVQAYLKRVEVEVGKEYVPIILQRIPTAGIASLKPSEYHRCVRLCQHYLNETLPRP